MLVILALGKEGKYKVRGLLKLHRKLETGWGYLRLCINKYKKRKTTKQNKNAMTEIGTL